MKFQKTLTCSKSNFTTTKTNNIPTGFTTNKTLVSSDFITNKTKVPTNFTYSSCEPDTIVLHDLDEVRTKKLIDYDKDDIDTSKFILPETCNKSNPIFNTQNLNVVEHPDHYGAGDGMQCIEAMLQTFGKDATKAFCKLNAFKYIWRSDHKEKEQQDMEKAKRYIEYWHVLNKLKGDKDDGTFHEYLNS